MKAIQLEKPRSFRLIDIPDPGPPGPGEALVRVRRIGICGTDFSGFLGKMPFFSYPRIPGHELGVEVVAVGEGVHHVQAGDRCSIEPYINCQACYACERGHSNCCENLQVLGVHTDGGMRPFFRVPARKLHPSRQLTLDQLALVETLAIGCHAVQRGSCGAGQNVLVIGAGPIGLSVIEFVKLSGARTIVLDLNEQRLAFVRETMGVRETLHGRGEAGDADRLRELTDGKLAHVVIDATGSHQSMGNALQFVGFAGKLVFVGITTDLVQFGHPLMHRREMTLLASRNALPPDFRGIIQHIEEGRIDTRPWMTHSAPFDAMVGEFETWLNPESRVIKAMVRLD
ncbi:MAG: zinc-binding alcohol dehydrogenase family protein [Verrucomicrobia bacterium]|nr:zinc-binding alcohol dehydrogenase family protein [Verrucomicrobiota bacterium]